MTIHEITERDSLLIARLTGVWEASVRETHLFLSDVEVGRIKEYVPGAIREVPRLFAAGEPGNPAAFMGISDGRIEMLFISPDERGRGLGRRFIELAVSLGAREVTVNEQNPQAVGFYRHMGFEAYKRTGLDEEGNPYPLLYMRLP